MCFLVNPIGFTMSLPWSITKVYDTFPLNQSTNNKQALSLSLPTRQYHESLLLTTHVHDLTSALVHTQACHRLHHSYAPNCRFAGGQKLYRSTIVASILPLPYGLYVLHDPSGLPTVYLYRALKLSLNGGRAKQTAKCVTGTCKNVPCTVSFVLSPSCDKHRPTIMAKGLTPIALGKDPFCF